MRAYKIRTFLIPFATSVNQGPVQTQVTELQNRSSLKDDYAKESIQSIMEPDNSTLLKLSRKKKKKKKR